MPKFKNITLYVLMAIVILTIFSHYYSDRDVRRVPYSAFVSMVEKGHVIRAKVNHLNIQFEDNKEGQYTTVAPQAITPPYLDRVIEKGVQIEFAPAEGWPEWLKIIFQLFPWLLFIGLWFYFINKMQGGSSRGMSFGRSRAKVFQESKQKVTFKDVAGCDEAKEELAEIIEFLRDRSKFKRTGARVPRGVLMMGPPGTGKTLLARAVAGEANVPFFHMSGSDFVEMFVGVGASRVRDLFDQGKKSAPCLIFIDEIDAVGRQRGSGFSGGNDEREQTLNQLLVEMDGFDNDTGIMVIAATNRADILDQALLRPGRFDRQVVIDLPDIKGREGILKVHMEKVPIGADVDVTILSKATPGFSGADLANMVNEAALLAAREGLSVVNMVHLEDARDKVMMGPERKSKVMSQKEITTTAYHEAGHALVNLLVPHGHEIHKATIIPRGRALGMVSFLPKEESYTREELIDEICVSMAGRSAEIVTFNTYTPGAASDIEQATRLARLMVTRWGMSDSLGTIAYTENGERWFGLKSYSDETAKQIDQEIHSIVNTQFERAKQLLKDNFETLKLIAETLMKHETLTVDELKALVAGQAIGPAPKRRMRSREEVEAERLAQVKALEEEKDAGREAILAPGDDLQPQNPA